MPPHYTHILMYIILSPLILASIVGNIITLIVKLNRRKNKNFNSGDLFVINLAICDLNKTWIVFYLWIYNTVIHNSWQSTELSCSVFQKLAVILFTITSLTLLVLTTERYFLIAKPFNRSFTFKKGRRLLIGIWLTVIVISSTPYFMQFKLQKINGANQCFSVGGQHTVVLVLEAIYYVAVMFVPCILIMIMSSKAAKLLHKNSSTNISPQMKCCPVFNKKMQRNQSAVYILRSISLGHIICYIPWAFYYMIQAVQPELIGKIVDNSLIQPVTGWFIFGSFCNTPFTYIIFSTEFRKEVREIFTHKRHKGTTRRKLSPTKVAPSLAAP